MKFYWSTGNSFLAYRLWLRPRLTPSSSSLLSQRSQPRGAQCHSSRPLPLLNHGALNVVRGTVTMAVTQQRPENPRERRSDVARPLLELQAPHSVGPTVVAPYTVVNTARRVMEWRHGRTLASSERGRRGLEDPVPRLGPPTPKRLAA